MKRLNVFIIKKCIFNALLIFSLYLILAFNIYPITMFIEHNALINTNEIGKNYSPNNIFYNNVVSLVQEYFFNNEKVYLVLNKNEYKENKESIEIIKSRFKNIKICSPIFLKLYAFFFKEESIVYLESEKLLNYTKKKNIKYVLVLNNIEKIKFIKIENILSLTLSDGNKIIITDSIKEKIKIKIEKENILVVDGDTIKYNNTLYRLIGIDAPELTQNYGLNAKRYLEKLINNSKNIFISVGDFDIYGRVLAHIFSDEKLVSVYMIKEKLAIQTITLYGDSGFVNYANLIIEEASKAGKVYFKNPALYRKTGIDKVFLPSKAVKLKAIKSADVVKTLPLRLTPEILMSNKKD